MVPAASTARADLLSGGLRWRLGSVGLRYELLFLEHPWAGVPRLTLAQHTLAVSWAPACDCWRLELFATQRLVGDTYGFPDVGGLLTVTRFGSIGVSSR
jgi:LPS-assembly protein